MIGQIQFGRFLRAALIALSVVGCATGNNPGTGGSTTTTSAGGGGTGGTTATTTSSSTDTSSTTTTTTTDTTQWPCGQDCSKFNTGACLKSVCNEGQYLGPIGVCTVVYDDPGVPCDDGAYCTTEDTCDGAGKCVGGPLNDCGVVPGECEQVYCDELTRTCGTEPADNGTSCNATLDLCEVNGVCQNGTCVGEPKDCTFSPLSECNTVACNPQTGECEGTADISKDGAKCSLTGDICQVNRTCQAGACVGPVKDCSATTVGCNVGVCDPTSGSCVTQSIPEGGECFAGIDQCHVGLCDVSGACVAKLAADGTPCNDGNPCTSGDVCTAGVCDGTPATGCHMYLTEGFESCSTNGWTLAGDWQCGAPTSGPNGAHGGSGVLATNLSGNYTASDTYTSCMATSPTIDLSTGVSPKLMFWVWMDTELSTYGTLYDGFNLKASIDGGTTYNLVNSVTPSYTSTAGGESAWGGHVGAWQSYLADLTPYIGHNNVKLRFAFRSDSISQYAGVYIDDLMVAESNAIQLAITTSGLSDAVADKPFTAALARSGGSPSAAWSILGGTNASWLTIDPSTGTLSGTPGTANLGPVTVQVQIQELAVPGNVATRTYTFNVVTAVYFESFEGACPNGWTLTGDWQCGTPTSGPGAAHTGAKLLATQLTGNYSSSMTFAGCTATSPAIDLTAVATPKLSFWVWMDTELLGSTLYDAFNLKVSTDNGATYTIVNAVSPAYTGTTSSESAWGGHVSAWKHYTADLTAFGSHNVMLRFAFRSDGSGNYAGVYIDDIILTDH